MNTQTSYDVDTVFTGRIIVDGVPTDGYITVSRGKIVGVCTGTRDYRGPGKVIDAGEDYIVPGAVDAHVHSYSHCGEGLLASTSAAAAGGVTTIIEMPFDGDGPINNLDRLKTKQDKVAREAVVDVALLGTLEPHGGWNRAEELVDAGVVGFKVSLFDTDPFRFPRISDDELISVMRAVGESKSTLCTHAENNEIIKALLADESNRASTDPLTHVKTRPPVAETLGALTAMEIAAHEGNALHLCHLSLGRSGDLVQWYQSQGVDVTFETCPHYLTFTEDDMIAQHGHLKINPPLRPAAEREAMWDLLISGRVPVVSSDHAPWPEERKCHSHILDNASGVPGVQTLVTATLGGAYKRYGFGKEFDKALQAVTSGPAKRYGLDGTKGRLAAGYDADIVFLSQDDDYAITLEEQKSNAGWTPYAGLQPGMKVARTYSRGRLVWDSGSGDLGDAGRGNQVYRR